MDLAGGKGFRPRSSRQSRLSDTHAGEWSGRGRSRRRQVADALVIAPVIVVSDEGLDLGFEIAREVIVFEQDTVLERLMPALDLSLGHGVIGGATDVLHVLAVEPFRQVRRDVAGA